MERNRKAFFQCKELVRNGRGCLSSLSLEWMEGGVAWRELEGLGLLMRAPSPFENDCTREATGSRSLQRSAAHTLDTGLRLLYPSHRPALLLTELTSLISASCLLQPL